jgi:uncharacterized secreted protein with C-terminal beta-propeller domain
MTRRITGVAAALLALGATGALALPTGVESKPAGNRASAGLKPFRSCPQALRQIKRHPRAVRDIRLDVSGGPGLGKVIPESISGTGDDSGAGGGPPPAPSSATNVQEPGVDEPDIVKASGNTVFALSGGRLRAVSAGPGAPAKLGALRLSDKGHRALAGVEMLVSEGKALVVLSGLGQVLLKEIDVSDPSAMRPLRTLKLEGSYTAGRLHGSLARIVVATEPQLPPISLDPEDSRKAPNKFKLRHPGKLIPRAMLNDRVARRRDRFPLADCAEVKHPATFSGLRLLAVLTIDLSRGLPPIDTEVVMTDSGIVYASPKSLYVATEPWSASGRSRGSTEIHKLALDPAGTTYAASGQVPGAMLSQWSLSEHEGALRVASTTEPRGRKRNRRPRQSHVTVLADDGAGALTAIGQVSGLGPRENIQAVRFIGDTGFVVTFRQIDPLYTLDLSQPSAPRVLGELKIRGFSAYLHPVAEDRLLGVGQDATPEGELRGTQLSLFDISNLASPVLLDQAQIGGDSSSEAELDHRAFLHWQPNSLAVIPLEVFSRRSGRDLFSGAAGFRIGAGSVDEVARFVHGAPPGQPIARGAVAAGRLVTISKAGALVSDIDSFAPLGWVPFREKKKRFQP